MFDLVRSQLATRQFVTLPGMFTNPAYAVRATRNPPFDVIVVDEAQDIAMAQLRFLAAVGAHPPDALFFAGDLGQRIFQQPFSWLALGVDIRGRSKTLRVNYRTSHQIRTQADRLLGAEVTDADGNKEDRSHTISVFNGPVPDIRVLQSEKEEAAQVATWIREQTAKGVAPHEFGVFVRSASELDRAKAAVQAAGIPFKVLDEHVETTSGFISIGTMHLAKGLEFRAVIVMACDDEIIPSQDRIENIGDEGDLQEVYDTECHLLYVACPRRPRLPPAHQPRPRLRVPGRPTNQVARKRALPVQSIHSESAPNERWSRAEHRLKKTQKVVRYDVPIREGHDRAT